MDKEIEHQLIRLNALENTFMKFQTAIKGNETISEEIAEEIRQTWLKFKRDILNGH